MNLPFRQKMRQKCATNFPEFFLKCALKIFGISVGIFMSPPRIFRIATIFAKVTENYAGRNIKTFWYFFPTKLWRNIRVACRRVARIWKREGAFLKEWEKCKRLWPKFSSFLNQFFPKIKTELLGKLGNSNVFSAQKQMVSKKKRSSTKLRLIFWPNSEMQTFFQPKNRWSPKKKKVFTEIETDFSAKFGNSNAFSHRFTKSTSQLRHPISFGGAVFNFSLKIGLKSTKNVRFCILHKPMGGSSPPRPPGYATDLQYCFLSKWYFCFKLFCYTQDIS